MTRPRRLAPAAALAAAALSGGCLIVSGKSVDQRGEKISQATLGQIVPGQTTSAWVLATLGEPADRTKVEGRENVEVWKYRHVKTRAEGGAVFLIFAGGSRTETVTTTWFEMIDGVVSRYWTEKS